MAKAERVHAKIAELGDIIDGVRLGPGGTLAGTVIDFKDSATQQERDAANALLAALTDDDVNVPKYVTRYQFKKAVMDGGQLQAIQQAAANLTDEAKLYWQDADRIGRGSILITELQAALGISDTAVDTFFRNAGKIEP